MPILQRGCSYIRDAGDFINKIENLTNIHNNFILVTGDVVGLYPSILDESGFNAIKEALDKKEKICQNNYFEFNGKW